MELEKKQTFVQLLNPFYVVMMMMRRRRRKRRLANLQPPLAGVRKEQDETSGRCRATAFGTVTSDDEERDGRVEAVFEGPLRRRTGPSSS